MYFKGNVVPIKSSASMIQNNLSIYSHVNQRAFTIAVISKNIVSLITIDENDNPIDFLQITPKPNKESASEVQQFLNILEAKFVKVSDRVLLVILSTKGLFIYNESGTELLYFQNSKTIEPSINEDTTYFRGTAVIKPNILAIGTSSRAILLFEIPSGGKAIELIGELTEPTLEGGITALVTDSGDGDYLISSDTSGTVGIWKVKSAKNVKFSYSLREKRTYCSCLSIWNKSLICGYSTGQISIFDLVNKTKVCTIFAHARYINSLDVMGDRLVSAGEDGFIRIWELTEVNGRLKITDSYSERIPDSQICAAHFFKGNKQICVSLYEHTEVVMFKVNASNR